MFRRWALRSRRHAGVLQGVHCGDGASIGHRLGREYEAEYIGPQEHY